jgi:hypothetical protein
MDERLQLDYKIILNQSMHLEPAKHERRHQSYKIIFGDKAKATKSCADATVPYQ